MDSNWIKILGSSLEIFKGSSLTGSQMKMWIISNYQPSPVGVVRGPGERNYINKRIVSYILLSQRDDTCLKRQNLLLAIYLHFYSRSESKYIYLTSEYFKMFWCFCAELCLNTLKETLPQIGNRFFIFYLYT